MLLLLSLTLKSDRKTVNLNFSSHLSNCLFNHLSVYLFIFKEHRSIFKTKFYTGFPQVIHVIPQVIQLNLNWYFSFKRTSLAIWKFDEHFSNKNRIGLWGSSSRKLFTSHAWTVWISTMSSWSFAWSSQKWTFRWGLIQSPRYLSFSSLWWCCNGWSFCKWVDEHNKYNFETGFE